MKQIGFVGIGMMGYPMASLLVKAGYEVMVFDAADAQTTRFLAEHSTATKADELIALQNVPVVITMLPDSDIVDTVVLGRDGQSGLIDILLAETTIIDMSSSQPLRSRALAQALAERGLHFLDAPVSGGVKRAVDGSLAIMVGGDEAQFQQHYDLFACIGQTITHVGSAGAGHAMKALNNYVSAAGLVATAEALLVGQHFGLDPVVMVNVLNSSTGKNNTTENKAKQFMLSGTFDANFALRLMVKDLGIAMGLSDALDAEMPLANAVLTLWQSAAQMLPETADHTEMYRYLQTAYLPRTRAS